ncbi:DUF2071 domain-containing protein [Lysinibacillus irui]|uniref:DUF2071 domain-containing protein n=2 Tax=Lysinibacillus irui TaxID=2998077 RepID=A0AAJ5UQM4_9BACI|nr:DUF2071 domain-containing protein [Lysinibacillus irui]MEA0555593.1 DUF2071 domain-containing protein [Lysinibacillus irui]MEA0977178.1 DUF2071 domain-containing protein [Lysinibacillus irui]MEA1043332.1 DUF2071 domain-containing protein [Lysinibacillus irui]WDV05801.1 DUF2071 domain-containing protein [Lysinibacillus irui]
MWMMTQTWQDVLFLHWPISPQELQKYIPNELQLDLFEENAWLSAVLFKVHRHRLRFLPPIPGMNNYLQLNVRTYVKYNGRKGIYFFHLDVTNYLLSKVTAIGSLPYRYSQLVGKQIDHHFSYTSHYKACDERLKVTFTLGDHTATNFDHWIVERYHSWSKYNNKLLRIDIHHSPWELQRARVTIQSNSLASFMKKTFQHMEPIAHYAKNKVARVFPPVMEHKKLT